jgi:hypothetical protein
VFNQSHSAAGCPLFKAVLLKVFIVSSPQIIGAAIGLFIASVIFWLVRRDHMVSKDGIRWLFVAALIAFYGTFPGLNDILGSFLGIGYPPIIPVLLGIGAMLLKLLLNDIERVKTRVDIERLVQRMAILEAELEQVKGPVSQEATKDENTLDWGNVKEFRGKQR